MIKTIKNGILTSLALLFVGVGLVASPVGATPVTLDSLINTNGSITVGDKLFDQFYFSGIGYGDYTPGSASGINVDGITLAGNYGLEFSGFMSADSFTTPNTYVDFIIKYRATVTDPNRDITDIHLGFNGIIIRPGHTSVVETVTDTNANVVGQVFVMNAPPILSTNIDLSSPQHVVYVQKDISLKGGLNGYAEISWIDQALSQTPKVPEPATLILLGSGLTALGLFGRKGKKA